VVPDLDVTSSTSLSRGSSRNEICSSCAAAAPARSSCPCTHTIVRRKQRLHEDCTHNRIFSNNRLVQYAEKKKTSKSGCHRFAANYTVERELYVVNEYAVCTFVLIGTEIAGAPVAPVAMIPSAEGCMHVLTNASIAPTTGIFVSFFPCFVAELPDTPVEFSGGLAACSVPTGTFCTSLENVCARFVVAV
jgi:hypothetical protein